MKSLFTFTPPSPTASRPRGGLRLAVRCGVLLLPAVVLACGAAYAPDENRLLFWIGAGLVGLLGLALLPQPHLARPGTGLAVIALYIISQVWLWFCRSTFH